MFYRCARSVLSEAGPDDAVPRPDHAVPIGTAPRTRPSVRRLRIIKTPEVNRCPKGLTRPPATEVPWPSVATTDENRARRAVRPSRSVEFSDIHSTADGGSSDVAGVSPEPPASVSSVPLTSSVAWPFSRPPYTADDRRSGR